MKVIIIDDDLFITELCEIILKKYNMEFLSYHSAEDFFMGEWELKSNHAIFLIDEQLPGMSGLDLSQKLRDVLIAKNVRLIAMTGREIDKESEDIYINGFDDLLMKPFTEDQLIEVLTKIPKHFNENNGLPKIEKSDIPDLSNLYKMADYDPGLVQLFIKQFRSDSMEDKHALVKAFENSDLPKTTEIIHRIAGRCSQIGAYALGSEFRTLEIGFRKNGKILSSQIFEIKQAIDKLDDTMKYYLEHTWKEAN